MAYDKALMYGLLMLVMIPVLMGFIGSTFGIDTDQATEIDLAELGWIGTVMNWTQNLSAIPYIGFLFEPFGNLLINVLAGYAIFPMWINFILIGIPSALVLRAIIHL